MKLTLLILTFVVAIPLSVLAGESGTIGVIDLKDPDDDPTSGTAARVVGLTTNLSGTETELGTYIITGELLIDADNVTEPGGEQNAADVAAQASTVTATVPISGTEFIVTGDLVLYDEQGLIKAVRTGDFVLVTQGEMIATPSD